ncbi:MAG TPA: alpha-L-arabinofuranosidase, partial [Rariglobus sp.]
MLIPFRFLAVAVLGLAALQMVPHARATPPPPVPKERTAAVFGAAVAGTVKLDVRDDAEAITGRYVAASKNYQVVATAPVPSEGATLHVWIRYRSLALQMKTRIGEKT